MKIVTEPDNWKNAAIVPLFKENNSEHGGITEAGRSLRDKKQCEQWWKQDGLYRKRNTEG